MYEYQLVTNGMEHGRRDGENAKMDGGKNKKNTYTATLVRKGSSPMRKR